MSEITYSIDGGAPITTQQPANFDTQSLDFGADLIADSLNTGNGALKFYALTQAEYDALTSYDSQTLYFIHA